MAASRGYAEGWIAYDEQYRLRKSLNPSTSWSAVDSELWMLYVSTPNASTTYMHEYTPSVHSGFTPVNSNLPGHVNRQTDKNSTRRITTNVHCKLFNKGFCTFGKRCKFSHKCSKCNWNHPAISCRN